MKIIGNNIIDLFRWVKQIKLDKEGWNWSEEVDPYLGAGRETVGVRDRGERQGKAGGSEGGLKLAAACGRDRMWARITEDHDGRSTLKLAE